MSKGELFPLISLGYMVPLPVQGGLTPVWEGYVLIREGSTLFLEDLTPG